MTENTLYKMREVTERLKVTPRTIRYYDKENLLDSIIRTPGGTRLFTDKDINRVKLIKEYQRKGFSLSQIKEILETSTDSIIDRKANIAVVTDSSSALPQIIQDELDIFIIPQKIIIEGKTYLDGKDLSAIDFFKMTKGKNYRAETLPPEVDEIIKTYQEIKEKGFTNIISLHLSDQWSKTQEIAKKAALSVDIPVKIINSQNVGMGLGLLVYQAAKLAKEKKKFSYIIEKTEELTSKCWNLAYINSLEYYLDNFDQETIKGNMLKALLDYKPVIFYDPEDGNFSLKSNVSSVEEGIKQLANSIKEYERTYGKTFRYIGITHSYLYSEAYDLMKLIKTKYPFVKVIITEASNIVSTYTGFYHINLSIC